MSNLSLERLLFDRADVSGSPQLGAHLLGDSSAVITSHAVSSDEGLDVYLLNTSIAVTASDLDIRDLVYTQDSISAYITNGTYSLDIDANGYLTVNVNGSVTVTASDLDIRDLSHTQDSVKIGDGTDFLAVNADGSINVNLTDDSVADDDADSGNPLKVGSRAYSAASALAALSASGDRADLLSDLYRRVYINDAPNINIAQVAVTVTDTEVALPTTALAGRTRIQIQNLGSDPIYIGKTGVTTATGLKVEKGATLSLEAGQALAFYGIAATGKSVAIRVLELA